MRLGIDVIERCCEAVGHRFGALLRPLALGLDLNDPLSGALILRPRCLEHATEWDLIQLQASELGDWMTAGPSSSRNGKDHDRQH